ncbi:ABC transporter ATP-binding protein [Clostridium sp. CM028]|uniref:ABC transporter ATP-binding protein n=1 Tax=unclassified Clostridium TaxID=2614128 RepID=UPI001C6EA8BB|nr:MULTISPECIES: ABC transporter ATP-binding protein [unclassified Clostridium]MBW9144374.1 ABC transporter ATP-binding protein [Clostridium sp. CM027]MBW9149389.1 ABC transporter ATP-binding protein [Clostridium sp. CM028]UVE40997.1 ABC transporter ATP-binding protein [Clostridium sp. CM027]WLC61664.1 ABC transporter ATP-binding protein [Clostridium sp. CM028]
MIQLKAVNKKYKRENMEQEVLKNIDMAIEEGDFITIMGPSGGGKSTLLYILSMLEASSTGEVFFDNKIISGKKEKEIEVLRRKNIGLIFQNSNLITGLTPLENLLLAMDSKEGKKEKIEKCEALLKKVGLLDKKNAKATSLSGGEAQRVAVVRALVNSPRFILCDEPTGALDSENGKRVIELLMRVKAESGCCLAIVTHDERIGSLGDRKFFLEDGVLNELA